MLGIVRSSVRDIFQGDGRIQPKPFGNGLQTFGSEGSFGVNVNGLAFGTAFGNWHLTGDAESVTQLRLARAELAKDFCNGPGLNPTLEELVNLGSSRRQGDEIPIVVMGE